MIPSSVFFISIILLSTTVCLSLTSYRSLLNISCIFLIHAYILFLRFGIIFTTIILNLFSHMLPISSSFIWSFRFLPCSFICNIFSSHLNFLSFFFFFFWWVGIIALQVVLAWGVQLWGLKAVGKSQVFVSRWEPPEDLTPSNIPWSLRFSVSLGIWTQSSHHRSSGLTPGLGTKIPQVYSKKRKKCERCRTIRKLKIKIEKLKMHVRK